MPQAKSRMRAMFLREDVFEQWGALLLMSDRGIPRQWMGLIGVTSIASELRDSFRDTRGVEWSNTWPPPARRVTLQRWFTWPQTIDINAVMMLARKILYVSNVGVTENYLLYSSTSTALISHYFYAENLMPGRTLIQMYRPIYIQYKVRAKELHVNPGQWIGNRSPKEKQRQIVPQMNAISLRFCACTKTSPG